MKKVVRMVALILCVLSLNIGVMAFTGCTDNDNSKKDDKYGYVTNSDGTRTWYEKNNKHIQVID